MSSILHQYRDFQVDAVCGIPLSWLREVDAACDAFFARRGMKAFESFAERNHREFEAAKAAKRRKG